MKIAYVYDLIYPYSIGGVEKRNWELARRLARRGHEVTVFGMKYWEDEDIIYQEGVRLWGVCPPQELYVNGRRSIKEAIYFAWKVLFPLLKERFDIIDVANFPYFPCFSAKLAAVAKKSRLIITWHEVWSDYWFEYLGKKGIFGKFVEKLISSLTNKVIANSLGTKKALQKLGVKQDIEVIPNGIDFKSIDTVIPGKEESDIIFAGRLIKEKNVALLIRAMNLVREHRPHVSCVIIGEGPERENLKELAHDLGLDRNICFKGFLEDQAQLFSYMKSSKLFVLPSVREGFGIVALEANTCGLPVVTVNHPRNEAAALINGSNGVICQMSPQSMADTILTVLEKNMSQQCLEQARDYDWDVIVEKVDLFYRSSQ